MPRPSRRWLALLVLTLLAVLPTVAAASDVPLPPPESKPPSPKVTQQQAIATVTAVFPVSPGSTATGVYLYNGVWQLHWNLPDGYSSQSASVDAATGEILTVDRYSSRPSGGPILLSQEEALAKAAAYIAKLAGEHQNQLIAPDVTVRTSLYNDGYTFTWQRALYGTPVQGDGLTIRIDPRTGELQSFNRAWRSDVIVNMPDALLSSSEAQALYQKLVPLELRYLPANTKSTLAGKVTMRLVYVPTLSFYPYMTHDGQLLSPSGLPLDPPAPQPRSYPVPAGDSPYLRPTRRLTVEEGMAVAKRVAGRVDDPEVFPGKGEPEGPDRYPVYLWNGPDGEGRGVQVSVDLDLGVVSSYNYWGPPVPLSDTKPPTASDPAQDRAAVIAFLQMARPDLAGSSLLVESTGPDTPTSDSNYRTYSVYLAKSGVRVLPAVAYVSLMAGAIQNFNASSYLDLANIDFPSPADVLSPKEIYNRFPHLAQSWVGPNNDWYGGKEKPPEPLTSHPVTFVWGVSPIYQGFSFDARSGNPIDENGRDMSIFLSGPPDVAGHFAEREIRILWNNPSFDFPYPAFHPELTARLSEVVQWFQILHPAYGYYGGQAYDLKHFFDTLALRPLGERLAAGEAAPQLTALLNQGVIKPEDFDPETTWDSGVRRELFALWAVRAINYSSVITMENRIELRYADADEVSPAYSNAVAFLQGAKIMRGDGQRFNPKAYMTRGEVVKVLFTLPAPEMYYGK